MIGTSVHFIPDPRRPRPARDWVPGKECIPPAHLLALEARIAPNGFAWDSMGSAAQTGVAGLAASDSQR